MFDLFEVTAGTIPGRRHVGSGNLLIGKNNQDAHGIIVNEDVMVLSVFDGCSNGAHTEVGAKIASKIVPSVISRAYDEGRLSLAGGAALCQSWLDIKRSVVTRLESITLQMASASDVRAWDHVVLDYMLFTIFGAIVTRSYSIVFSIGDGIYSLNGESRQIGPFAGNAPPYIGYALLSDPNDLQSDFVIHEVLRTQDLQSLIIGTDGMVELESKAGTRLPGKNRALCSVSDLSDDRFFAADQSLTCWLRQVNSEVVKLENGEEPRINREHGLLSDDTTMVVARRRR
jgi:hypothetical protein